MRRFCMFAVYLNDEEREKLFELIYKLACCDGECTEEEEILVNSYQMELAVDEVPDTASIAELTEYFAGKDRQIKKMVLFEICTLILTDNHVGENEQKAYGHIKKALALGEIVTEDIVSAANDYKIVKEHIYDTVFV
jgi:hypothetical protein